MKNCQKCSHQISEKAKACPMCGHPNKQGTSVFTWVIAAVVGVFFISALAGGNNKNAQPDTASTAPDTTTTEPKGTLIPRSSDDRAKYYLLSKQDFSNGLIETVHSRVSKQSTGYTRLLINCADMTYKELGYSDVSIAELATFSSNPFTDIVIGSSKSDIVIFVCR
jgi:hypothetical protein